MKATLKHMILITVGLYFATTTTLAQSSEAIQEERALGFVRAVQAGDVDALLAYMHENWGPPSPDYDREKNWPGVARSLIERHPGLTVQGVDITEASALSLITQDADGNTLTLEFEYQGDPPYLITGVGIRVGDGGPASDLPELNLAGDSELQTLGKKLGDWFDQMAADDTFSGSALVAWQGEVVFKGAWGLASKRWNVQNSMDTRFDLGSINKSFTQVAIGQLLAQGKLTLDDPISKHLPDYPNKEAADKITIRHLREHTAGLGDIFTDEFFASSKSQFRSPRDFFVLFADRPLQSEPGEKKAYSNAAYMVLGAIIEEISGQPFDEYVDEHIFRPAGMIHAGFFANDEPEPNVATGYTKMTPEGEQGDTWRSNVLMLPARGNSAGSAQATAEDLWHFDTALRNHRLLPPAYTSWYFGGPEPTPGEPGAGGDKPVRAAEGIAGGAPGVSASLESDGELAVIVLSNYDAPITEHISRALFRPLRSALGSGN